jgi:hypothetical protein
MDSWRNGLVLVATLLTGCTGEISGGLGSPTKNGAGNNGSGANGSGNNGSGANGSGNNGSGANGSGNNGSGASSTGGAGAVGGVGGSAGGDPTKCVPGVPATSQLPRLTHSQYDNTIRDLVGLESNFSSSLAPDTTGSVDQRLWDSYKATAETVTTQIMGNATAKGRAVPCTPSGDGAACAQELITTFGRHAFRRPLSADEIARFTAMYTNRATLTATGTFDEAASLIIKSFLISPSFLTRSELGGAADATGMIPLDGYQVASRLSYMLWGSMPDDALLDAAADSQLATPEQILAQAKRMLADPRARAKVGAFHEAYALMGDGTRWSDISHDTAVYPQFQDAMGPMMVEETRRFFDHVVFDLNGTFQDLILKPVGFVNASLAPLYGLSAASYGADLVEANLDATQRAGVFTRLGFLTSYSLYNRTSPILRGAFLQKQVLCTTLGTPDPEALNTPLPTTGSTNRERVAAQTAGDTCNGCHLEVINPTGFALENYDAVGKWQTTEGGATIDTSADVLIDGQAVAVTGGVDLMNKIAASQAAKHCYAQHWVEFAYERVINPADACTVDTLSQSLTQGGYTVQNLIADLTQSQTFRYRVQEP